MHCDKYQFGSADDVTLPKKWPIPLDQIKSEILVWNAEEDVMVGNMTYYLYPQLQNADLVTIPEAGHMWIVEHLSEVLGRLIASTS